jgi:starvation-inducible DNA-binding protein
MAQTTAPATKKPATKKKASKRSASKSATAGSSATATAPVVSPPARSGSRPVSSDRMAAFTVPGLDADDGRRTAEILQDRLVATADLALVLKHIHWNVVGPHFIAVHQMLDPQYVGVQAMVDELAERIAALGGVPRALPGAIVERRSWDDYELDRADAIAHLGALDLVYSGVISDHREAIEELGDLDPMSEDLLVGATRELEQYQWFIRSHLADWAGGMATAGAVTETDAARAVLDKRPRPGSRGTTGDRS